MAFQVRLDLTPAEFDLLRRALDSYRHEQFDLSKLPSEDMVERKQRREAGAEALAANMLLQRMK